MARPEEDINDFRTRREKDRDSEIFELLKKATVDEKVDRSILQELSRKSMSTGNYASVQDIKDIVNPQRKRLGKEEI